MLTGKNSALKNVVRSLRETSEFADVERRVRRRLARKDGSATDDNKFSFDTVNEIQKALGKKTRDLNTAELQEGIKDLGQNASIAADVFSGNDVGFGKLAARRLVNKWREGDAKRVSDILSEALAGAIRYGVDAHSGDAFALFDVFSTGARSRQARGNIAAATTLCASLKPEALHAARPVTLSNFDTPFYNHSDVVELTDDPNITRRLYLKGAIGATLDTWRRTVNDLADIQQLVKEIADHLKAGDKTEKRKAIAKLKRVAAIAGTLALTLQVHD